MQSRPIIRHIVSLGDSLTDRGTMYKRTVFGIPLRYLIGIDKTSPKGRFTNGYTWNDDFGTMLANMLIAKDFEKKSSCTNSAASAAATVTTKHSRSLSASDIADRIIEDDFTVIDQIEQAYSLDDDKLIQYKNTDFLRSHAEGGLTAHDYSDEIMSSKIFAREIVSNLTAKRNELLDEDAARNTSQEEKSQTLITELSGANDMITVNDEPTKEIVDKAIAARVENIKELIKNGYQHFALINLPDLSLTPKCQSWSAEDKTNLQSCIVYFNEQLQLACEQLRADNPNVNIHLFDIYPIFNDIINNPEKYELDKSKQSQAFTSSPDFKNENGISHAPGFTFWDELHPTAHVHNIIADRFYGEYSQQFDFETPAACVVDSCQALCEAFMPAYLEKLRSDRGGFFGYFRESNLLEKLKKITIEGKRDFLNEIMIILDHALNGDGDRTRAVLQTLGWIDANNNINVFIPTLAEAKRRMSFDIDTTTNTHSRAFKQK